MVKKQKIKKTDLILRELIVPRTAEELSNLLPIKKSSLATTLSIKVSEGILAKSDTNPRKYVLKNNKSHLKGLKVLPTVQNRIGSLKKLPEKFTAVDFAEYWEKKGYDYEAIKESFDYIVSVLGNKIIKIDKKRWRLENEHIKSNRVIHKKVDDKILCGYNNIHPIEMNMTDNDKKVTCKRCLRDMILNLSPGMSQKKRWIQTSKKDLVKRIEKLKRIKKSNISKKIMAEDNYRGKKIMTEDNYRGIMEAVKLTYLVTDDIEPMIYKTIRILAQEIINYTELKGHDYLIEINAELIKLIVADFSIEDIHDILKEYDLDYII